MSNKIKMPRNRKEFEDCLINTFLAGCWHGYIVEHTVDVSEQEMIGALEWIGRLSYEEAQARMEELFNESDR